MRQFETNDTINNRYTVVRKLGAGAMGSVYLCEDVVQKNVQVALKVLVSENLEDQDIWAKGEYEALTRLRHPNLARVFNFGRIGDSDDYFIASEFIKGLDLYSATEHMNYDELIDVLVQIARALEYIHSQGYVHFDIKPDNILVTRYRSVGIREGSKVEFIDSGSIAERDAKLSTPKVKVIDFGLAEKITGSFSFAIKGTLNYLAPEILNGQTPDKRADLYSLGVTVYQIANRGLPLCTDIGNFGETSLAPGATREAMFEMQMKNHPEFLRQLILRLLAEKPEDRFQSAKEIIYFVNANSDYSFEVETKETRASYFFSPKLIGRKREMNLLKDCYEKIFFPRRWLETHATELNGISREENDARLDLSITIEPEDIPDVPAVVLVSGEMGSGKSRTLEEFQHFLRLNDVLVFAGNCYEGNNKAYQPFVQILHEIVYRFGLDSEIYRKYQHDIVKLLPELPKENSDEGRGSPRPDKERIYFIERIAQLFLEAAQRSPFVMFINNLHWVDEASGELLSHFFDRLIELREQESEPIKLLVIGSVRPEDPVPEKMRILFDRLRASDRCEDVTLRPLRHAQIAELLCSMLAFTEVPERFVVTLESKTGGNPLFLVETLKALQDEGVLRHTSDGWTIRKSNYDRIEIPQSMEDMLERRFEKFDVQKREILEVLSVIDKPVSPRFLQALERFKEVTVLMEMRDLEQMGLVTKLFESGKLRFQLAQTKTREILYARLDDDRRRAYHGAVGDGFQAAYRGKEEEILEELAFHYQRSDRVNKAIELSMRAGDRARAIYANESAFDYYAYVLEKVDGDPEHTEILTETLERVSEICTLMGRYDMAERGYKTLLEDHGDVMGPGRTVRVYSNRGKVFEIQGDYDSALRCYKDARDYLAGFKSTDLVIERIRVFNSIGWIYVNMGKYEKAMAISDEALGVIENLTERTEHAMVYNTIGRASFYKGNYGAAIEHHRRGLEIRENLEDTPETTISHNHLASAFMGTREYGEALDHLERALESSREIGDPYGRALTLHNLARLYLVVGQADECWKCLEESLALSKDYSMRYLNVQNYVVRGEALREAGEYSKAEGNFFRALTAFTKQGNRWGLCTTLLEIVALHRLQGSHKEALGLLDEAARYARELDIPLLHVLCLLEEARLRREDDEDGCRIALQSLEKALAVAAKGQDPELSGEVSFEIGETLVRLRLLPDASQHYAAAKAKFREVYDNLPESCRASYGERQRERFRDWTQSVVIARETTSATTQAETRSATTAEETLRRVGELMAFLPSADSLRHFLEAMADAVVGASQARSVLWLIADGNNLRVETARAAGGAFDGQIEKTISLELIEHVISSGDAVLLADSADDKKAAQILERTGHAVESIAVLAALLEPNRYGILYVCEPVLPSGIGARNDWLFRPFVNLAGIAHAQLGTRASGDMREPVATR